MSTGSEARTELGRVVDRLRSMPLARLARPWGEYSSLAAGARALAQDLADRGADLGGWPRRAVPDVGDAAVGDQVAITGHDLLDLVPPPEAEQWMAQRLRYFRLSV